MRRSAARLSAVEATVRCTVSPSMVLASSLLIFVYGAFMATRLPIDVFPDLNRPTVTVLTEAEIEGIEGAPCKFEVKVRKTKEEFRRGRRQGMDGGRPAGLQQDRQAAVRFELPQPSEVMVMCSSGTPAATSSTIALAGLISYSGK